MALHIDKLSWKQHCLFKKSPIIYDIYKLWYDLIGLFFVLFLIQSCENWCFSTWGFASAISEKIDKQLSSYMLLIKS